MKVEKRYRKFAKENIADIKPDGKESNLDDHSRDKYGPLDRPFTNQQGMNLEEFIQFGCKCTG